MSNQQNSLETAETLFRKHGGILRASEAIALGIHPRTLCRLRNENRLVTVSQGLYRFADLHELSDPDLVSVAARIPQAVICLVSALAFHEITTEIPHEVSIALPRTVKRPRLDHPPLRIFWFSGDALSEGVGRFLIRQLLLISRCRRFLPAS
jgi:predicted transcriptional regulator of viral defense system